ncbi:MAG: SOS response-associated peptidase [Microvirga sp.]
MCNLYSVHLTQADIRRVFEVDQDLAGNLPVMPAVFPDQLAPVVRLRDGRRELLQMRWGFPPPPKVGNHPVTNVRNTASPFWRAWLKPEFRVLVPLTSFCEYEDTKPRKTPTWFALGEDRPAFAFAGIWRPWKGTRGPKADAAEGEHLLFSFLTTDANAEVAPVHPKAMPVILTTPEDYATWLTAPVEEALKLQRPLPDGALTIVARGERSDQRPGEAA